MSICPQCDGGNNPFVSFPMFPNKKILEFSDSKLMSMFACSQCNGTGEVPKEMLSWISNGKTLRDKRVLERLTLRKASKLLNIKPSILSDMERGKIEPDMKIEYKT